MFRIPKSETFSTTVEASLPSDRPGKYIEGTFTAVFLRPSKDRYVEIIEGLQGIVQAGMTTGIDVGRVVDYKTRVLEEVLQRIEGIGDDTGELPPDAQRRAVLDTLPLLNATFDSFTDAYTGSAAKNSNRSPKR